MYFIPFQALKLEPKDVEKGLRATDVYRHSTLLYYSEDSTMVQPHWHSVRMTKGDRRIRHATTVADQSTVRHKACKVYTE